MTGLFKEAVQLAIAAITLFYNHKWLCDIDAGREKQIRITEQRAREHNYAHTQTSYMMQIQEQAGPRSKLCWSK